MLSSKLHFSTLQVGKMWKNDLQVAKILSENGSQRFTYDVISMLNHLSIVSHVKKCNYGEVRKRKDKEK